MKKVGKVILMIFGGLFILIAGLVVIGILMGDSETASTNTETETAAPNNSVSSSESETEENEKDSEEEALERAELIRESAIEADFMKIYNGEYSSSDVYKLTGEATVYSGTDFGDEIGLSTTGDDNGEYIIQIMLPADFEDGDTITVYGNFDEEFSSLPTMKALLIE
ncbi:MAG: Lipoprotein [Shouchella clausii]